MTAKTKKCFSKCRKLPENTCNEKKTICQFTNGPKLRYCRLSKLYTLDKNCNMTKKNKKLTKIEAAKIISKFIIKSRDKRTQKNKKLTEIDAAKKIRKFIIKTQNKRTSLFLKSICPDSGACISFGTEIQKINKFFNYFVGFEYAVSPVLRIGVESTNGLLKEIKYNREGYNAYAVLKSSILKSSDNLMYEYEVGQFINKQNRIFPCFLETYGMFHYKSEESWTHLKETTGTTANVLKNSLIQLDKVNYSIGCRYSKFIAILIQHIKNSITLKQFINSSLVSRNIFKLNNELSYLLYQVYMPLSTLKNEYTHYDLHSLNVLVYEPIVNSYITYNYHLLSGNIVSFNSKYIAKIIDYGRNYYKDEIQNSKQTYNNICKIRECQPECGKRYGLSILEPEKKPGSFYYITAQVRNASHDLRLLNTVRIKLNSKKHNTDTIISKSLNDLLKKLVYNNEYGTKEETRSGLPTKINNVSDASKLLEKYITDPTNISLNEKYYAHYTKIGEFNIYEDRRPMKFIKK